MNSKSAKISRMKLKTNVTAYLFLLPNLLGFMILTFIPAVASLFLSLMSWNGAQSPEFVGLANFQKMFNDSNFTISLFNTFYYALFVIPLTMIIALVLAILINQKIRFRNALRAIYFFPYVASLIAVASVWTILFEPTKGPINQLLISLGVLTPPGWLGSTKWAMPVIIIVSVWKWMGYYMVLFLAGLQGVPAELYEAASIDGATALTRFRYVTIPMIAPTTFFVAIMLTINSFKIFDMIAIMTDGGPGRATKVLVYYIYQTAFKNSQFGYASAISMILFALVLAVTLVQMKLEKKWVNY